MNKNYITTLKMAFWGYLTLFMLSGGIMYSDMFKSDAYYPITAFILCIICGYYFVKNLRKK